MSSKTPLFTIATLAAVLMAAPAATAQIGAHVDISNGGFSFGIGTRHVSVGVSSGHHVHCSSCRPVRHRGHWQTYHRRVWRPARYERVYVPARYVVRHRHGRAYRRCVRRAGYRRVYRRGYWDQVSRRRWVDGYTSYGCGY